MSPGGQFAEPVVIDTHSHLLPGLDDGAASLEESVEIARRAWAGGVREIVCTPHLRSVADPAARLAPEVCEEVRAALARAHIPLHLHLGYELTFSFAMDLDPVDLRRFTLGSGGRALLVEVPYDGWPAYADQAVYRWRLHGFWPVLAHPERNERAQRNPALVSALVALGAGLQGTAPSLAGRFGPGARRYLLSLLRDGQMCLFASDTHSLDPRQPALADAAHALVRSLPGVDVARLTALNPARMLRGEAPEPPGPVGTPVRRGTFLRRLTRRVS
ncbi:MAG: tyrosine-protein phosphatase [Thermoleophilia bacterium]